VLIDWRAFQVVLRTAETSERTLQVVALVDAMDWRTCQLAARVAVMVVMAESTFHSELRVDSTRDRTFQVVSREAEID
jgi:hypothetical protein